MPTPPLSLTTTQASAIVGMGPARHDYNHGVLAMLGLDALHTAHVIARRRLDKLLSERETAQAGMSFEESLLSGDAGVVGLDEARAEAEATWKPIRAIIDQACAHLDGAPDAAPRFGQHV